MNWEITIKKVDNGYILSVPEQSTEGFKDGKELTVINLRQSVLEDPGENENTEKETMGRVLGEIADYFGFHYQKYNKNNLKISWDEKGSKVYDDED